jgi:hypothetical protein
MGATPHWRSPGQLPPSWEMSVLVWSMVGLAIWHLAVLVPDRFLGGIIGALLAAVGGALLTGYLLPAPGIPEANPPGLGEALWPIPCSLLALAVSFVWGSRREASTQGSTRPRRMA